MDGCCTKWWFVAVIGSDGGLCRRAEGVAEEVDGVALESESDVGVHRGGHLDMGMAQQLLEHDELDPLLQEEGGCRVPEIMKPDAARLPGGAGR